MNSSDNAYFERRLNEELQMSESSTDPIVASAHRRMARYYQEKLAALDPAPLPTTPPPTIA